jgi:hypothetical protein
MPTLAERLITAFSTFSKDNPRSLDLIDELYASDMIFEGPLQRVEGRAPSAASTSSSWSAAPTSASRTWSRSATRPG